MLSSYTKTVTWGDKTLKIETGHIARQSSGAVLVSLGDTTVLVTAVIAKETNPAKDFFPMRVDYQEKLYAAGKIPGGFFKREGRPSEREILVCRLIDRPIRPLFPAGYTTDVQIVATVLSLDPEIESDIPAMIGASASLALSGAPITDIMGAIRIGYIHDKFCLNPSKSQLKETKLNLIVAGTKNSVLMVESEAKELSEETMLKAVMYGQEQFIPVITAIEELAKEAGKEQQEWQAITENTSLKEQLFTECEALLIAAYQTQDKITRYEKLQTMRNSMIEKFCIDTDENTPSQEEIKKLITSFESNYVRNRILNEELRIDGRNTKEVRPLDIRTKVLARTHGSALFTRGETQAMVVTTLGTSKDALTVDSPSGEYKEHFMLHYNFPPYSVGEIGMFGSPKRREIGHGNLARRAMESVLPSPEDFPYSIRVVSEITESNGSSSMATVCGTSLSLMDAGVPIKAPVAGIAMGLIKQDDKFTVLTDILGDEDHLGDMDFKVAGTKHGVTALQMDIKINGITKEIMEKALEQAREGRLHILDKMNTELAMPRNEMSQYTPRITSFKVSQDKIREVIGKGGTTIRNLIAETGANIDINEEGLVSIFSQDKESANYARAKIEMLTAEIMAGQFYDGKVVRITDFGAFVNLLPGKDGLVHISQMANSRVKNVTDILDEGQIVKVKVMDIDRQGRVKLTMLF